MRLLPTVILMFILVGSPAWADDPAQPKGGAPAATSSQVAIDRLLLGTYWWGAKVTKADLEGRVVLWVAWGSTVGARQVTPALIALAKRLEGRPFHLIASHREDPSSRGDVIAFLRNNRMSASTPNFTITKDGNHPDAKLGAYVPYYVVFDHTGRIVQQHMGGSYFGGDQLAMVGWVDKLLKAAPAIYLGATPFRHLSSLAQKVRTGKGLQGNVRRIESILAAPPDAETKAEAERLLALVTRYRDRQLAYVAALEGSRPSALLTAMKRLAKTFRGTSLGEVADRALANYAASDELKAAAGIEKKFRKIVKAYEKVKESKRTDAVTAKAVKKLEALLEGHDALPFADTIQAYLMDLR